MLDDTYPSKYQKLSFAPCLSTRASSLVQRIARGCTSHDGFGSMSVAIYDTAWLSMVNKQVDGVRYWIFPECFAYILGEQQPDGSWPTYASPVDGILNTSAALLALVTHASVDALGCDEIADINSRILRGEKALSTALNLWDVGSCVHVGFEILVPSLLHLLEQYGIWFDFPSKARLFELHSRKLVMSKPEALYSGRPTTLLHSLEALIGVVDFDKLEHHKTHGGMLGSPASTAAYLMHCSTWDEEAEAFLKITIRRSGTSGAVPSAFPSTIFESTWVLSTLLSNGYSVEELGPSNLEQVARYLGKTLETQSGLVGFAPGLLADADDTAKTLLTLRLLGKDVEMTQMIDEFEAPTHFKTYQLERDPSFSANCNVLLALLSSSSLPKHIRTVEKAVTFLCSTMDEGLVRDKWNLSTEYPYMLLCHAFIKLLQRWNEGSLGAMSDELIRFRIPVILCQLLVRTLVSQLRNGSWGNSVEVTAYGVLTVSHSLTLPWSSVLQEQARLALDGGRDYLERNQDFWNHANYLWVEKVSYGSPILAKAYCLAAMRAPSHELTWDQHVKDIFVVPDVQVKKMAGFFSRIPLLRQLPARWIQAALVEAYLYYKRLRQVRLNIFPRTEMAEDKYLEYIPFTWTGCNRLTDFALSGDTIWNMMVLSMLNYQVDEYMEAVVARLSEPSLALLETIIREKCGCSEDRVNPNSRRSPSTNPKGIYANGQACLPVMSPTPTDTVHPASPPLHEVVEVLTKYVDHVRHHPCVLSSPEKTQKHVARELCVFLLAHIKHSRDNARFAAQDATINSLASSIKCFQTPGISYFNWVRTTSADHTSCPYSFAFFCCLVSKPGSYCLADVKQLYLGQALCRHLATLCRQYNDYGSLMRDQAEGNLNSLNFPEFASKMNEPPWSNGTPEGPEAIGATCTNGIDRQIDDSRSQHSSERANETGATKETAANAPHPAANQVTLDSAVEAAKADLMEIADFERACMELTMQRLGKLVDGTTEAALRTFVNVTDLYGQIYVARDIASRMK